VAPEGFSGLRGQDYGASFTILRCREAGATLCPGEGATHSHHALLKFDIRPSQCEQFPDAQSCGYSYDVKASKGLGTGCIQKCSCLLSV
jgi:hypothetical protein